MYWPNSQLYTLEPLIAEYPKCRDFVLAYMKWLFTRMEPQEISSEKSFASYNIKAVL